MENKRRTKQEAMDLLRMLGTSDEELEEFNSKGKIIEKGVKEIEALNLVAKYLISNSKGFSKEADILLDIAKEKIVFLKLEMDK